MTEQENTIEHKKLDPEKKMLENSLAHQNKVIVQLIIIKDLKLNDVKCLFVECSMLNISAKKATSLVCRFSLCFFSRQIWQNCNANKFMK